MAERKHILEFETEGMVVTIATDSLQELSEQSWFKLWVNRQMDFIGQKTDSVPVQQNVQNAQMQQYPQRMAQDPFSASVSPAMQRPAVQQQQMPLPSQPEFMRLNPNQMTPEVWGAMTDEQRQRWRATWIGTQR